MRWLKRGICLFILAWIANIASFNIQGTYQGVTGNVCGTPETDGVGDCYEALPTGGFPITYAWDNGGVSVVGKLSIVEDRFEALPLWLNFGFYFLLFAGLWWGVWAPKTKTAMSERLIPAHSHSFY